MIYYELLPNNNGSKGNANTGFDDVNHERRVFMVSEIENLNELIAAMDKWIDEYSESYLCAVLEYKSSNQIENGYNFNPKAFLKSLDQ